MHISVIYSLSLPKKHIQWDNQSSYQRGNQKNPDSAPLFVKTTAAYSSA